MRNQPHHLPRWIVLPLPLTPRWLAPIHSDAEPLSGRQQVADAGGSASPTVHPASNRETCLASQRSRPAGVRTPRCLKFLCDSCLSLGQRAGHSQGAAVVATWSFASAALCERLGKRSGWANATTSLQDARAANLPHMAERYRRCVWNIPRHRAVVVR
jgi:hypothetical protein